MKRMYYYDKIISNNARKHREYYNLTIWSNRTDLYFKSAKDLLKMLWLLNNSVHCGDLFLNFSPLTISELIERAKHENG